MTYKPGEISSLNDLSLPLGQRGVRQGGLMNREVMGKNLLDFKEILDRYKILFIMTFGGLLGLIREGNFIKWDKDIEVACLNKNEQQNYMKMKDVKKELIKKGFKIVNSSHLSHYDFFIRNGERIEINWFTKIGNEWIKKNLIRYPSHYFDNLGEIKFLGTTFKIPSNVEDFLKKTYGKNWRIPNPKGKYIKTEEI